MTNKVESMISFETPEKLLQHITLHVLTPEEAHAWYFIWRETDPRLAPTPEGVNSCFQIRSRLHDDDDLRDSFTAQYLMSISEQIQESVELEWTAETYWFQVGFSLSGVFYVLAKASDRSEKLVTAYVPGFGTAAGTKQSREKPADPHARIRCTSWMRDRRETGRADRVEHSIAKRLTDRRVNKWNADQRLYFLVFRPAMQFLRGWQDWRRPDRLDMSSLQSRLPLMSQLKLESWMELRTRRNRSKKHG